MRAPTFKLYTVFDLTPGADISLVKKAWRSAARRYHPDRNPDDPKASERFAAASRAWQILSDPKKKAMYDVHGDLAVNMNFDPSLNAYRRSPQRKRDKSADYRPHRTRRRREPADPSAFPGGWGGGPETAEREPQRPTGARANKAPPPNAGPSFHRSTVGAERPGGGPSRPGAGRPRATPGGHRPSGTAMPKRGADLKWDAVIPLKTAALGGPWVLEIERPERCEKCQGTGWRAAGRACNSCRGQGYRVVQAEVTIRVPPDTQNNRVITTKGEGAPGVNGGENGDLWTTVKVAPDPRFQRRGLDLWTDAYVPANVARNGGEIDVRNLHELVTVPIPAGTQTGKIIRNKGRGIPGPRGRLPGDLHVRVVVDGE